MPPSKFSISKIGPESDDVLRFLLRPYLHEMAEWFDVKPQPDGSYGYDFASIWTNYDVYLAVVDDVAAGFALVGSASGWLDDIHAKDVHEFFVMREFRRVRVGQRMATFLWEQYPGEWLVRVLEANAPALLFWRTTISSYSRGSHQEEIRGISGRTWRFFRFISG